MKKNLKTSEKMKELKVHGINFYKTVIVEEGFFIKTEETLLFTDEVEMFKALAEIAKQHRRKEVIDDIEIFTSSLNPQDYQSTSLKFGENYESH